MADDFVEEVIEDYKAEETHFHSSVTDGYDDQHARLVFTYWLILLVIMGFKGKNLGFDRQKIHHDDQNSWMCILIVI